MSWSRERARGEQGGQALAAAPLERRDLVAGEVEQPDHGRLPASRPRIGVSWARCSAVAGQRAAVVKGISVRSRPTPAAPPARPSRVSAAEATLHRSVTGSPSAVRETRLRDLALLGR